MNDRCAKLVGLLAANKFPKHVYLGTHDYLQVYLQTHRNRSLIPGTFEFMGCTIHHKPKDNRPKLLDVSAKQQWE